MINKYMNYKKHYDLLIERARTRQITGYVERHHIVPRCMGGTNEKTNLVELTPEEHYIAHQLLVKIYPNHDGLVYAARKMTITSKNTKRNNKLYGWLKRRYQSVCKKRVGNKNPSYGRSWYYSPKTLEEGKFLLEDVPSGWIKGRNTTKPLQKKICKNCGQLFCERKNICQNTQRINRLINNFNFDTRFIGTEMFYVEYDRVVEKIKKEYLNDKLSVENLRKKYNVSSNETMRCILRSLDIERRTLSESVKNYRVKSG
jgi:hypothetical protein